MWLHAICIEFCNTPGLAGGWRAVRVQHAAAVSVAVQRCIAAILVGLACLPFDIPFTAVSAVVPAVSACREPWLLGCFGGFSVLFGGPHRMQHILPTCAAVGVVCVAARALAPCVNGADMVCASHCIAGSWYCGVPRHASASRNCTHPSQGTFSPNQHRLHVGLQLWCAAHWSSWLLESLAGGSCRSCLVHFSVLAHRVSLGFDR